MSKIENFRWRKFPLSYNNFISLIISSNTPYENIINSIIKKLLLVYPKKTIFTNISLPSVDKQSLSNLSIENSKVDTLNNLLLYNNSVLIIECSSIVFDDITTNYFEKFVNNNNHIIFLSKTTSLPFIIIDTTDLLLTNDPMLCNPILTRKFKNSNINLNLVSKEVFFVLLSNYPDLIFGKM